MNLIKSQSYWTVLSLTEQCTGLPEEDTRLKTKTTFPVNHGALVTVSCDPNSNAELRGDNVITCEENTLYNFKDKPRCNDMGESIG